MRRNTRSRTAASTPRLRVEALEPRDVPTAVGALDPTFGTGGTAAFLFNAGAADAVAGVALDPAGRVVVGATSSDGTGKFAAARLTPAGVLDAAFNAAGPRPGVNVFDLSGHGADLLSQLAVGADGRIVVAGAPSRAVPDFFAFGGLDAATLRDGAFVAAGDIDRDGFADFMFGGGPVGGPRVPVLSGKVMRTAGVAVAQFCAAAGSGPSAENVGEVLPLGGGDGVEIGHVDDD